MNYYEHHIRDYDAATAHLSWDEDLAYTRLIRWYYRKEQPLPSDVKEVCRQIRATTKVQRDAVATVLNEFFELRADGWHQKTCDEVIAAFQDGEPEREVKKANEENRLKKHRLERSALFKRLTDAGQHAAWNIRIDELRELVANLPATPPETPSPPLPATAPATPATATQTPDTRHQYPEVNPNPASTTPTSVAHDPPEARATPSPAALLSKALRAEGIESQPADPRLIAMAVRGVSAETLKSAATEAKRAKPGERIPVGYVLGIVERWAKEAAALSASGATKPAARMNGRQAAISNYAAQAAAARGDSNEPTASSERDITGEVVRIA